MLFSEMASTDLDWGSIEVWQVDERVAPDGDDDRNAGQLDALPATTHPMPVTDADLTAAAAAYAASLPARFDVVHLGLGDDGHSASWAPDPHPDAERALSTRDAVFTIAPFNGRPRMTLNVDVVNAARARVVLVMGESKAGAVARWVHGLGEHGGAWIDTTLPIAALDPHGTVLFLDHAAAVGLGPDAHDPVEYPVDAERSDGYGRER